jgi:AraC-like DNA-binding protein
MSAAGPERIKGWSYGTVLLEWYAYAPGPRVTMPSHAHHEYCLCVNLDLPGQYQYRGGRHTLAPRSLAVVVPGEVHAVRDPEDRQGPGTYRVLYAAPELLRQAALEVADRPTALPFFPELAIQDAELVEAFLTLHWTLERPSTRLERDVGLVSLLACLVARHADIPVAGPAAPRSHRAVELARDYLEDNYRVNVSLQELARVASLSPSQLVRVFRAQVGLPPHAYQLQARVARAKRLLLQGWSVGRVAQETGFFDERHLARHFKRLVGIAPGGYTKDSKNVPPSGG